MDNLFLTLASYVAPALIGYGAAATMGPNKGLILGAVLTLVVVFVLLLFQVTPADSGPGSGLSARMGLAWGLMWFSAISWIVAFLVGGAVGSLQYRARRK